VNFGQLFELMALAAGISVVVGAVTMFVILRFNLLNHRDVGAVTEPALKIFRYEPKSSVANTEQKSKSWADNSVIKSALGGVS